MSTEIKENEQRVTKGEYKVTESVARRIVFKRDGFTPFSTAELNNWGVRWTNISIGYSGLKLVPGRNDTGIHQMSVITSKSDKRSTQDLLASEDCLVKFNQPLSVLGHHVTVQMNMEMIEGLTDINKLLLVAEVEFQTKRMLSAAYWHKDSPEPTLDLIWTNSTDNQELDMMVGRLASGT